MGLDYALFRVINGLAGRSAVLDGLMRLLVNEYFIPTLLALLLMGLWFSGQPAEVRRRHQRAVLVAILGVLISAVIVKLCNLIYFRPRPFTAHPVTLLFYRPTDSSWPSNPATVGFAIAAAVWLHQRWAGLVALWLASLFAFARVYSGVHYPLDVVSGAILGAGVSWLVSSKLPGVDHFFSLVVRGLRRVYLV